MALVRQISEETIGRLNSLYEAGNWWKTLVDHPNTFVAVRPNNTISVYGGGGSIARISFQGTQPSLRVHVKYLAELPQRLPKQRPSMLPPKSSPAHTICRSKEH